MELDGLIPLPRHVPQLCCPAVHIRYRDIGIALLEEDDCWAVGCAGGGTVIRGVVDE